MPDIFDIHRRWLTLAVKEAEIAASAGEVPVGALVVKDGIVLGKGFNRREALHDPTAHAEIIAITAAAETLGDWRLDGCTIYVTLEPCPMCAGAVLNARLKEVVFGARDHEYGACGTVIDVLNLPHTNHKVSVLPGVMESECKEVLNRFFSSIRNRGSEG